MTTFSELGLAEPILKALGEEGYTAPTPIQAKAIPAVLAGSDLLGIAQTGTGKTAAFALPILHRLAADRRPAPRKGCRVLVLSPTRELASQIADSFRTYGRHLGMTVAVVYGGVAHRPQINALARGVDVLVATPGRLIDHIGERNAALAGTEVFVLDEADQMLDLGFVKPIRRIVGELTSRRQNLFFSATMPAEISGLADELLRNPVKVSVAPAATTVQKVAQRVIHVEASKKKSLLAELISDAAMSRTLVFTRTKRGADRVARHLETGGVSVSAIHGNKSQRQREAALDAFRTGDIRVLVATDIAARGIDVDLVTHVINFELPEVPEAYVHRIGRTARAGASGTAISLCDGAEFELLRAIERLTRQSIPSEDRRRDSSLAVDVKAAPGRAPQRGGGKPQRQGHGGGEHRNGGRRDGRPGERHREPRQGERTREAHHGERTRGDARQGERGHGQHRDAGHGERSRGETRHGERARDPQREARHGDRRDARQGERAHEARQGERGREQHREARHGDAGHQPAHRSGHGNGHGHAHGHGHGNGAAAKGHNHDNAAKHGHGKAQRPARPEHRGGADGPGIGGVAFLRPSAGRGRGQAPRNKQRGGGY